jgi:hypothetical protein
MDNTIKARRDALVAELLDAAAKAIGHALAGMDEHASPCPTCEVKRFRSYEDHKNAELLRGALSRVERVRNAHKREQT